MTAADSAVSPIVSPFAGVPFKTIVLPFGALILASSIWGTSDVASKRALEDMGPMMLTALRFIVAAIALEVLCRRAKLVPLQGRMAAALGLVGVSLACVSQNFGLRWTSASDASLIQGAGPALAVLLAIVVLRERPKRILFLGIGVSLAGVATVALAAGNADGRALGGNLLILLSAIGFAAFIVIGRNAVAAAGAIPALTGAVRYALMVLIPAAIVESVMTGGSSVANIRAESVVLVLYLGIACSALTYALWGFALQYLESSRAAVFDKIVPIVGVAAAGLFLGETVTARQLLGIALVLGGV
ncbi:MAG: DMT family transporter, partial [Thermomicrobiales bacterium]